MAVAAMIFCGCASISESTHAYLGSPHLTATNPDAVQIYPAEPKQPKVQLGEVMLLVEGNPSREKVEQKMKAGAAQLGADGVFIVSDRTHINPVVYWNYAGATTSEDWHRVIVGVAFKNVNHDEHSSK